MSGIELEIVEPHVEFITEKFHPGWADATLRLIEECGRVSHKSEGRIKDGSAGPFIRKVAIDWGHESILEHVNFTVCFVCSRAASHQLVRHRLGAYTQESQRYCDYSKGTDDPRLRVIVPPSIGTVTHGSVVRWNFDAATLHCINPVHMALELIDPSTPLWVYLHGVWQDCRDYLLLIEAGIPAEDARYKLPAIKTEVYTTFNLRQWRHFFRMRLDKHAQWEIKRCAAEVYNYFKTHMPLVVENLKTHSGDELI